MIKIDVLANINDAVSSINNFQKQSSKSLETLAKQGKSSFDTLGSAVVVLNQGLELVSKGFNFFSKVVSAGVKASVEQEEAINDLNAAMKASGTFTNAASQDLQNFSSSLQKNSTIGDEVILKTAALGVSLGKLSGQQLKDATLAAANLSSALGISLDSAMQKIVKSSIDGGTGLRRYGIAIEKGATDSVTLANAIDKVNTQFAGAAASKVQTYKGALDQANNAYGDMLEKIGEFVTRNPLVVKVINIASKAFDQIAEVISKFSPQPFNDLAAKGIVKVIEALIFLVDAINPVISGFKAIYNIGAGVFNGLLTVISGVTTLIATAFVGMIKVMTVPLQKFIELVPDSLVPEGWAEGLASFNETLTIGLETGLATTTDFATNSIESFAAVGDSFVKTIGQDKLDLIKGVLTQTSNEIKKAAATNTNTLKKAGADQVKNDSKDLEVRKTQLDLFYAAWKENLTQFTQYEQLTSKQRVDGTRDALSSIATLTSSSNRKLFEIGKAAAVTTATVDGIMAVQKTLASTPYPINFALAALVGVATAANVAKIASQSPPKFERGGIVGGSSFSGDQVPIRVNSGEMILNRESQQRLFNQINNGGGDSSEVIAAINRLASQPIVIQVDGIEIARATRDAVAAGFAI